MKPPVVSVILPVYNGRRYLRESIDSVLAQTEADFELIIWDDGSADDTAQIASSYRDRRVRAFRSQANQGLFPTLNLAITQSRGRLIRFWAQDDRMKPECIARETEFWRGHPAIELSYCQADTIDAVGNVVSRAPHDPTPEIIEPWLSTQISFYHSCMPGNISTVTVRKAVLDDLGTFADLRVSGDFEMWTRISGQYPIGFIREALVELRSHADQLSRRAGEGLHVIRENRQIFARLLAGLPPELERHARSYHRRRHSVGHVHYMLRSMLSGDLGLAREVLAEVRKEGNAFGLALLWAVTLNGRMCRPRPKYLRPHVGGR